jgi:hypothetical protein
MGEPPRSCRAIRRPLQAQNRRVILGICGPGPNRAPEDDPGGHQPLGDALFSAQKLGGHPGRRAPSISQRRSPPRSPVCAGSTGYCLLVAGRLVPASGALFRHLYDEVRLKGGAADFSMDTRPYHEAVGSVLQAAFSQTLLLFYGLVLIILLLSEALLLHKTR